MSTGRTHARNLTLNTLGFAANLVVMFLLSPFVVRTLGKQAYGVWSLLTAIAGYMGVLDLGIRASVGRHICLYLGKGDHKAVDETIRAGLSFFSVVGLLVVGVGVVLGWAFPHIFESVPIDQRSTIAWLLPLLAANLLISAGGSIFSSVLAAHDRFDLTRGVDFVVLGVRTAGLVMMLKAGYGLVGMALATIGGNCLATLANYLLARRVHDGLRVWPLFFSKPRAKELFGFGLAAFITSACVKIIGQTDLRVMEWAENVDAVAVYAIGAMGVYYSQSLIGQIRRTFFPPVQRAVAAGDMESARWYYWRQSRLALLFGLPMYVGTLFFAYPFIHVWMGDEIGPESVRNAAMVMMILSGSKLLMLMNASVPQLLIAMGHVRRTTMITVLEATVNLGLSLFLAIGLGWGMAGVACGTLFARALTSYPLYHWLADRTAGLRLRRLLARNEGLSILAGGAFAGICWLVRQIGDIQSWAQLGLQILIATVCYTPVAWFVLLPKADRRRVLSRIGLTRETPHAPEERP